VIAAPFKDDGSVNSILTLVPEIVVVTAAGVLGIPVGIIVTSFEGVPQR
jgi:hypothetical protein